MIKDKGIPVMRTYFLSRKYVIKLFKCFWELSNAKNGIVVIKVVLVKDTDTLLRLRKDRFVFQFFYSKFIMVAAKLENPPYSDQFHSSKLEVDVSEQLETMRHTGQSVPVGSISSSILTNASGNKMNNINYVDSD